MPSTSNQPNLSSYTELLRGSQKVCLRCALRVGAPRTVEVLCSASSCGGCQECCICPPCSRCSGNAFRQTGRPKCAACSLCSRCCQCQECTGCRRRVTQVHDPCHVCDSCCPCPRCTQCSQRPSGSLCHRCSSCGKCCVCSPAIVQTLDAYREDGSDQSRLPVGVARKHLRIRNNIEALTFHDAETFIENPHHRYASFEIEVEANGGSLVSTVATKWKAAIVGDGSVSGFEINTAPANGDALVDQIEEFCHALISHGAYVNTRCGSHCHVDVRDLDYLQLISLIGLIARAEPWFFSLVPQVRRTNSYCRPLSPVLLSRLESKRMSEMSPSELLIYILTGQKDTTIRSSGKNGFPGLERYLAFNFQSIIAHQTLECRLHSGTLKPDRLIGWAKLLCSLIERAKTITYEESWSSSPFTKSEFLSLTCDSQVSGYIERRWHDLGVDADTVV